jgi:hypothetical protein
MLAFLKRVVPQDEVSLMKDVMERDARDDKVAGTR